MRNSLTKYLLLTILIAPITVVSVYAGYIFTDFTHINDPSDEYHVSRYYKSRGNVYLKYDRDGNGIDPVLTRIKEADADTFECLRAQVVFKIIGMNPSDICGEDFLARDKNFAYFFDKKIEGSHGSTFTNLAYRWSKDQNYVYWEDNKLEMIDVETFEVTGNFTGQDRFNDYEMWGDAIKNTPR